MSKSLHPESKAKFLYKLTEKGISLLPVLIEIYLWGEQYFELSENHKKFLQDVKKRQRSFSKKGARKYQKRKKKL
ncbi:winged helix-turn-helix transcriptional regulator [Epilithonimonas sp.]|uniref:winged helix-turn-helix transcriptional regulator n=1 Tax=Epilithonimonas sp. TaxID=2894511 RepID=UPI0039185F09